MIGRLAFRKYSEKSKPDASLMGSNTELEIGLVQNLVGSDVAQGDDVIAKLIDDAAPKPGPRGPYKKSQR